MAQQYNTPTAQYTDVNISGTNGYLSFHPNRECITFSYKNSKTKQKTYTDSSLDNKGKANDLLCFISNKFDKFCTAYNEWINNNSTFIGISNGVNKSGNKE